MDTTLFQKYAATIKALGPEELAGGDRLIHKMLLAQEGDLSTCYAPFEYVNEHAKVVIVGITPGKTQMVNAIKEARRQIDAGADDIQILKAAKQTGAFSGAMRPNLVALLDTIGINQWLGISSCDSMLGSGSAADLVQTTSALRNPVFFRGENYSGSPNMIRTPFLRAQLVEYLGRDLQQLKNAVFVPLGDKVAEALRFLADKGMIQKARILDGLPHPSGANAERIAYFLQKKSRQDLSIKTDPNKLDAAKEHLLSQVSSLN
jgi:hypothetical protein